MAASDAQPFYVKGKAACVVFPIFDADGDLVTGAAGLDSEISKDLGTFADCTNEATEIATNSGMYYLNLTATEMTADVVAVIVKTSSTGAKTTPIVINTLSIAELSGPPGFADGIEEVLSWLLACTRNKIEQTDSQTIVRKDDGTTALGTSAISDTGPGGTFTRGEFT